jgi:hypothetical protein
MIVTPTEKKLWSCMPNKICTRCNDDWPSDHEFYRSKSTPWCIACEKEAGRHGDKKRKRSAEYLARQKARDKIRWATTAKQQRQEIAASKKKSTGK